MAAFRAQWGGALLALVGLLCWGGVYLGQWANQIGPPQDERLPQMELIVPDTAGDGGKAAPQFPSPTIVERRGDEPPPRPIPRGVGSAPRPLAAAQACRFYVKGADEKAGYGHAFCKRDNAWVLLQALRKEGIMGGCFVYFPARESRAEDPPLDSLFPPPSNWTREKDGRLATYRRRPLPSRSTASFPVKAVQYVASLRAKGELHNSLLEVPGVTSHSHCASVPIVWRPLFRPTPATLFEGLSTTRCLRVAVHARGTDAVKHKERNLPQDYFGNVAALIVEWAGRHPATIPCIDFHVFTDNTESKAALFIRSRLDGAPRAPKTTVSLHLRQTGAAATFSHFALSDILVTTRSGFSHLAGMVSEGVKIAAPFWHATDCDELWVPADPRTGRFDPEALSRAWASGLRRGLAA